MKTKYIRNQSCFMVFPESCQHREMAIKCLGSDKLIHGAGFMFLKVINDKIEAECYGHSISLNKSPRHDDNITILKSIGVENLNQNEVVESAKYVIFNNKAVVFSNQLEHKKVAENTFYKLSDCKSAGLVKFTSKPNGKINIQCYGESANLGLSAQKEDIMVIANLMDIPENILFFSPVLKC